ncbi:hypothetical protein PTSG_11410 [Salpingoeca rosetta]|uniref:Uncharacterized protein n=1 Tax=Salpingoeca rosetta (strain ATCC 50818 / BSB-021) TaxID=946362 RepID=F2UTE7_SALR5|nr:uncharacterized protein PTSG_11410 [Salpingoeca rosetta]EGD82829.1 hypothetical protein PTSG_11410 [Salpingoeca rosetta]|eukprot:XP_004987557.1 hypothetical protein PTSG_11410 [Salpingoeca rosetta]
MARRRRHHDDSSVTNDHDDGGGDDVKKAKQSGRGCCDGMVLVCDMDSTLVERPQSGLYPTLKESPCYEPVLQWLRDGGCILLNTTAHTRARRQFWDHIPPQYRRAGQVAMATCTGAAFVTGHCDSGDIVYSKDYIRSAVSGGTCLTPQQVAFVKPRILAILRKLYTDMAADPALIHLLSDKYQEPFSRLCARIAEHPGGADAVVTEELITTPGAVLCDTNEVLFSCSSVPDAAAIAIAELESGKDGSCSSDNSNSSSNNNNDSSSSGNGNDNNNNSNGSSSSSTDSRRQHLEKSSDANAGVYPSSMTLMGVPRAVADKYFGDLQRLCAQHGIEVSFAPNSVWFFKLGVNKATPIGWLRRSRHGAHIGCVDRADCSNGGSSGCCGVGSHGCDGEHGCCESGCCEATSTADVRQQQTDGSGDCDDGGDCGDGSGVSPYRFCTRPLDVRRALAIGDAPSGNDGPMAEFRRDGMEFVSCAGRVEEVPEDLRALHVGGKEAGTAAFVSALKHQLQKEQGEAGEGGGDTVLLAAAAARAVNALRKH